LLALLLLALTLYIMHRRMGSHAPPLEDVAQVQYNEPALVPAQKTFLTPSLMHANRSSSVGSSPVSPPSRLRRCSDLTSKNRHFADAKLWSSLSPEDISVKKSAWKNFLKHEVFEYSQLQSQFNGRGIVYTATTRTMSRLLTSIKLLRHLKCNLPIEVWHIGDELGPDEKTQLFAVNATAKDVLVEQAFYPGLERYRIDRVYERNYHVKSLALMLSSFQEIIYLDSDNYPMRNPAYLFHTPEYKETGSLFWPDLWKLPSDNPVWRILDLPCEDEWEQEAGQLVLDKQRVWKGLFMSLFFQMDHTFYFRILLGDKDTFRLGWRITNTPYHMVRHPVAVGGRVRQGRFCGISMLQFDPAGQLQFVHTTVLKGTRGIGKGNTWESIQYFAPTEPGRLDSGTATHTSVSLHVDYPLPVEYSGGAEKSIQEGGSGIETAQNPCVELTVQKHYTIVKQSDLDHYGSATLMDSFRPVSEDFKTYSDGSYAWFEDQYYELGGKGCLSACHDGR
jgi:hypothetical protein